MGSTTATGPASGSDRAQRPGPLTAASLGVHDGYRYRGPEVAPVLRTEIDVDAYTRLDHSRLPVDREAVAAELPEGDARADLTATLAALHRLEASALAESRAMLSTWTANESRITAFLATWLVQRHWQARALRDLVPDADWGERPASVPGPAARLRRLHVDRIQPLLAPAWTVLAGEAVTAGHMSRLAVQEASLRRLLQALAAQRGGETARVLRAVAERHDPAVDFFRAEARTRVLRSPREARIARLVLSLSSPWDGGGVPDPDLPSALRRICAEATTRAALRQDREDITRLLPLSRLDALSAPPVPAPARPAGSLSTSSIGV